MSYLTNQLVWCFYEGLWYPCLVIDRALGLFHGTDEVPPGDHQRDVLWLGDGRVSRLPVSVHFMRDFCASFEWCFARMNNENVYIKAVELCVKIAAQRCREAVDESNFISWANKNLKHKNSLTVSHCFYEALKDKSSSTCKTNAKSKKRERRLGSPSSHFQSANKKSCPARSLEITAERDAESHSNVSSSTSSQRRKPSPQIVRVERECPVGWLAWYKSTHHKIMLPCLVIDPGRFRLEDLETEKIFISSLVQNSTCFTKYKVLKRHVIDFCSNFNAIYQLHETECISPLFKEAVCAALQLVAGYAHLNISSNKSLLKWAKNYVEYYGPLVEEYYNTRHSQKSSSFFKKCNPKCGTTSSQKISGPKKPKYLRSSSSKKCSNFNKSPAKSTRKDAFELDAETMEMLSVPLNMGFVREVRDRLTQTRRNADVYYITPDHSKTLRSGPEVQKYLTENNIQDIRKDNFLFKDIVLGLPNEVHSTAGGLVH